MIAGARTLSSELLDFVEERSLRLGHRHGISSGFLLGNEFFCALDSKKATNRLSDDEQMFAIKVLAQLLDDGVHVTIDSFQKKVCRPIKYICVWCKQVAKQYADVLGGSDDASTLTATLAKTKLNLIKTGGLRQKVVDCINTNQNIAAAVLECKVLVDSLKACRARRNVPTAVASTTGPSGADASCDSEDDPALAMESIAAKREGASPEHLVKSSEEREAEIKAQMDMDSITTFTSMQEFQVEISKRNSTVHCGHDWLVLIGIGRGSHGQGSACSPSDFP